MSAIFRLGYKKGAKMENSKASKILFDIFDDCIMERVYAKHDDIVLKIKSLDELESLLMAIETAILALDKESET